MPVPRYLIFSILAGALAIGLPAPASAEPSPSELMVARRLFEEAKSAADGGRFPEAAEKFRQAAAIKDTPGIRFHLARCEEEQGAFVEALVEYDRAQELLESGIKAPDVQRLLPAARERLRAKIVQVKLRLPADVTDASVSLDGKAVSRTVLHVPLPINPGRRRLLVTAPGRSAFDQQLELSPGEQREVTIVLPSRVDPAPAPVGAPAVPPRAPSSPADSGVPARTVVLVGEASLLVAGLATGVIFSIAKASADERFERANDAVIEQAGGEDPGGTACSGSEPLSACADLDQARKERNRAGTFATIGFVTAGVSVASLGLTWLLWPASSDKPRVGVAVAPGSAEVSLSGRF